MKWHQKALLVMWLGLCLAVMTKGVAWGGDCTTPDDCGSVPDNGSRAAAAGGALAGGALAARSRKKKKAGKGSTAPTKPGPCAPQQQAVTNAQGQADMYASQRQSYLDQMEKYAKDTGVDDATANQALTDLRNALSGNLGSKILLTADGLPADASDLTASQMQALSRQFGQGPAAAQVAALAQAFSQLQQDMSAFDQAKANWKTAENNYEDAERALQAAKQALQDCINSQSGSDGGQSVASGDSGQGDGGGAAS